MFISVMFVNGNVSLHKDHYAKWKEPANRVNPETCLKGLFTQNWKLSSITHPLHLFQTFYDFLSSAELKGRYFEEFW